MTGAAPERYAPDILRAIVEDALRERGARQDDAAFVADALVETDLRGIGSHGVTRLTQYVDAIESGAFDPEARPQLVRRHGCIAQYDARAAFGHVAARDAMDTAIELSGEHGVGIVTVRNSNHFGAAFLYPLRATEHDRIGFITTNGPPVMPAFGGATRAICNNPLSWGIPTAREPAIILDMACMVAARGKITLAAREGRAIPEGWALTAGGRPTTDPLEALDGLLQPVGGAKGYGLAVVNEILSGALTGARVLDEVPDGVVSSGRFGEPLGIGHLVIALDPAAFLGVREFKDRVEYARDKLKASPTLPGFDEVLLPGEPEYRTRQERLANGVPLEASTVEALRALDPSGRLD